MTKLPIVLVHGFPYDGTMWEGQAAFLRSLGLTVHTPDVMGFGKGGRAGGAVGAAPAKEKASIELYAEQLHTLIAEKCGGKTIVGGFSMGGYILLALLRDYPEDVAAAMFIDTRVEGDTADARAARMKSIEELQKGNQAAVVEGLLGKQLSKKPSAAVRAKAKGMMESQPIPAMIAAQSAMAKRRDQSDLLAELKIPVLIVVGAEDQITPPSVALAMQSHMPHAMVVQVVGAGHMAPIEQPEAVNGAMQAFLGTVE